ncbi:hypothetical protein CerSpe_113180 [Prunus speciosa]
MPKKSVIEDQKSFLQIISQSRIPTGWCGQRKPPKASYILKTVSCDARPGEITAIAGPSGAGKTTLLEILAGMIPLNNIVGQVLVNEQPMNAQYFRRISGYVT